MRKKKGLPPSIDHTERKQKHRRELFSNCTTLLPSYSVISCWSYILSCTLKQTAAQCSNNSKTKKQPFHTYKNLRLSRSPYYLPHQVARTWQPWLCICMIALNWFICKNSEGVHHGKMNECLSKKNLHWFNTGHWFDCVTSHHRQRQHGMGLFFFQEHYQTFGDNIPQWYHDNKNSDMGFSNQNNNTIIDGWKAYKPMQYYIMDMCG